MRGLFITIEGIDGCGKSTQSLRLAQWLERKTGFGVLRTFEPGGWEGGAALRSLILTGNVPDAETELLLFLADRSGHVGAVVCPALEAGQSVVCERYSDSTWAYQVGGGRLAPEKVRALMELCAFPEPDLTLFLDIEPEVAASRLVSRGKRDRIEAAGLEFMARVAHVYRERAAACSSRILIIPAEGTEEEVASRIERGVSAFLKNRGAVS
ncbi:MAG: dTMP kinase [Synergistaceae bacterium]|nr:dTMP kinase [Synergistaceae bacterium]